MRSVTSPVRAAKCETRQVRLTPTDAPFCLCGPEFGYGDLCPYCRSAAEAAPAEPRCPCPDCGELLWTYIDPTGEMVVYCANCWEWAPAA